MISIKITHLRGEIDMNGYIDFNLIKKYPNKYNLTPSNIEKLKILNWEELKKYLRHKIVLKDGVWWEHFEGCNFDNDKYDDYSQFRIAFNEKSNKIICGFTTYFGCIYSTNFIKLRILNRNAIYMCKSTQLNI